MRSNPLIFLAGALALGLVVAGCSKKKDASSAANPAAEPANQATTPAPAENEVPHARDLQLSVDAYQKIYKRKPASLEQMMQEGFLASLPPAPPGKRFTLDPATTRVSVVPQ
jgi:hypothetical protein